MRMSVRVGIAALAICGAVMGLVAVSGCTAEKPAESGSATTGSPGAYSGQYPIGVAVRLGTVAYTLKSVQISDLQWPYQDTTTAAPKGKKWAYAEFTIEGPDANPAPGGGYFYPEFRLLVDGKTMPVDIASSGGDVEAPPGVAPRASLEFLVPESAHSVALLTTPSFAETQTVAFRLW